MGKNDPYLSCNHFFDSINYQLNEFAPFKKVTKEEYNLMLHHVHLVYIVKQQMLKNFVFK